MYHLLIVDDEIPILESLASDYDWLSLEIGTVHRAASGAEAYAILTTYAIDILITDIRMPGMSGIELICKIREEGRNTACLILSGYADFDYVKQALIHQSADYLLKPVREEDLFDAVRKVINKLKVQWEEVSSMQKAMYTLRENLPAVRGNLLNDILHGYKYPVQTLDRKLALLEVPFLEGDVVRIVLIRMESGFAIGDDYDLSLLEYAVGNIIDEILDPHCYVWRSKDRLDYIAMLVKWRSQSQHGADTAASAESDAMQQQLLELYAIEIQKAVHDYLKGHISVLVSPNCNFPQDIRMTYEQAVSVLRKQTNREEELFLTIPAQSGDHSSQFLLSALYEPPTLHQLLDGGRWEDISSKLEAIFLEVDDRGERASEFLIEAGAYISSAFAYIAHKNGQWLSELVGDDIQPPMRHAGMLTVRTLRDWSFRVLQSIRNRMETEIQDQRSALVMSIRTFIEQNLSNNVSLNAIADHIYLHPVYLSKIYKTETGEGLSEYIHRLRMEKAIYFLIHTDKKVYDIAGILGFPYTPYFIRVFKKHVGVTPQEFRLQQNVSG